MKLLLSWTWGFLLFLQDSSSLASIDDGCKIDIGGIPKSDPPSPGTYLRPNSFSELIGPNDRPNDIDLPSEESDGRDSRPGVETTKTNDKFRDEFEVAGWMYGNQLRSLDPQQRFITEKLVADIVFKARLKMLKITSRVDWSKTAITVQKYHQSLPRFIILRYIWVPEEEVKWLLHNSAW